MLRTGFRKMCARRRAEAALISWSLETRVNISLEVAGVILPTGCDQSQNSHAHHKTHDKLYTPREQQNLRDTRAKRTPWNKYCVQEWVVKVTVSKQRRERQRQRQAGRLKEERTDRRVHVKQPLLSRNMSQCRCWIRVYCQFYFRKKLFVPFFSDPGKVYSENLLK